MPLALTGAVLSSHLSAMGDGAIEFHVPAVIVVAFLSDAFCSAELRVHIRM